LGIRLGRPAALSTRRRSEVPGRSTRRSATKTPAPRGTAGTRQAGAVALDEGDLGAPRLLRRHHLVEQRRQPEAADDEAVVAPRAQHRHAQVDDLGAAAVGHRHEVAAREQRRRLPPRGGAGDLGIDAEVAARHAREQRRAGGRIGEGGDLQCRVATLDAQQLGAATHQLDGCGAPGGVFGTRPCQQLQLLHDLQQLAPHLHRGLGADGLDLVLAAARPRS
jgi:hypothetical protein